MSSLILGQINRQQLPKRPKKNAHFSYVPIKNSVKFFFLLYLAFFYLKKNTIVEFLGLWKWQCLLAIYADISEGGWLTRNQIIVKKKFNLTILIFKQRKGLESGWLGFFWVLEQPKFRKSWKPESEKKIWKVMRVDRYHVMHLIRLDEQVSKNQPRSFKKGLIRRDHISLSSSSIHLPISWNSKLKNTKNINLVLTFLFFFWKTSAISCVLLI